MAETKKPSLSQSTNGPVAATSLPAEPAIVATAPATPKPVLAEPASSAPLKAAKSAAKTAKPAAKATSSAKAKSLAKEAKPSVKGVKALPKPSKAASKASAAPKSASHKPAIEQSGETLRLALKEAANATASGAIAVNDKVLAALRAQSDAAFDLWRSTLGAPSMSEAFRLQAGGVRHVYETTATHWKDVAETAKTWLDHSVRPIHSMWTDRFR